MSTIQEISISIKITYLIRNILSRPLFKLLEGNLGRTLDIGGGSFYKNLAKSTWSNYFVLEVYEDHVNTKYIHMNELTLISEFILRYYNKTNRENKLWFLNYENYNYIYKIDL